VGKPFIKTLPLIPTVAFHIIASVATVMEKQTHTSTKVLQWRCELFYELR